MAEFSNLPLSTEPGGATRVVYFVVQNISFAYAQGGVVRVQLAGSRPTFWYNGTLAAMASAITANKQTL